MSIAVVPPSTALVGLAALAVLAVFGGYTASFACLVLERREEGRRPGGRSACACGTPIPMSRNLPVITWVLQRGRAACCHRQIPAWYVVAEFGTAAAPVLGALLVPTAPLFGALSGVILAVLVTTFWRGYDRRRHGPATAHTGSNV